MNKSQRSDATTRALARVRAGERPTRAATAERINPSTVYRALARERPSRLFLVVASEKGGLNAWIEDQLYRQQGKDEQFATIAEVQIALPRLIGRLCNSARNTAESH